MLDANKLACIRDDRVLFSGFNLRIEPGDIVQIEGANGAGKTSLLRILAGLARPDEGEVRWRGRDIQRQRSSFHHELLYLGHQAGIKSSLSPLENLLFYQSMAGKRDEAAAWQALEQVGLLGYEELAASGLSAGQQRRIALARLWISTAALWILDEPLTAIDQQGTRQLMALFHAHAQAGGAVLLTTHQPLPGGAGQVRKVALAPMEAALCSG